MYREWRLVGMNNCGIYKITNTTNGKFYIGSSVDLKKRKRDHFRELRNNIHCNSRLQNSFNKYGEDNFMFVVVEMVSERENLVTLEQHWIDTTISHDKNIGFNINRLATGGGNFGKTNGNYGNRGIKNSLSKPIAQIDIDTLEVIKVWSSSMDIKRELKIHGGNVCKMCAQAERENVLRKANGFYWCYEKDIPIIKQMKKFTPKKRMATSRDYLDIAGDKNPRARKVVQITLTGKYVATFNTVKQAAESINIKPSGIYSHLSNNRKNSGGFKWMYKEDYDKLISEQEKSDSIAI